MPSRSQTHIATTNATGQNDAGKAAGIGAAIKNTRGWQNFLNGRRLASGPALLIIVASSILLWIGVFWLLRTAWHFL
jgi:hypothetical protein